MLKLVSLWFEPFDYVLFAPPSGVACVGLRDLLRMLK